jgi:hypothetical protein
MLVSCMSFKIIGKVFMSKFVGTGPLSYEKRIYQAAVSQRLRNTSLRDLLAIELVIIHYIRHYK